MPIPGGVYSAPTVTLTALATPSPGVRVVVSGLAAGSDSLTVWRSTAAGGKVIVRGADHTLIAGTFTVDDYEAPIGQLLTYTAATFDSAGIQSDESAPKTITLTSTGAWLTDPLTPGTAVQFQFAGAPDRARAIDHALLLPVGADAPVMVYGTRQRGSFKLTLMACNPAERDLVRAVLEASPVLLLRTTDPTWDVPNDYYGFGDFVETRMSRLFAVQGLLFVCDATIVARPAPSLQGALHTWAELADAGITWGQLAASSRTWLTLVQLGPP